MKDNINNKNVYRENKTGNITRFILPAGSQKHCVVDPFQVVINYLLVLCRIEETNLMWGFFLRINQMNTKLFRGKERKANLAWWLTTKAALSDSIGGPWFNLGMKSVLLLDHNLLLKYCIHGILASILIFTKLIVILYGNFSNALDDAT